MSLVPRFVLGSLDLTDHPFAVIFGAEFGAPENVYEVLDWLLYDGEAVSSDRTSNRELTIPILIEGADLSELAANEARLVAETDRSVNTLSVSPGDGAPTSVFETFRGQLTLERADGDEIAGLRRWSLVIAAQPFVRSQDEVVVEAESVPSEAISVVIDDGSSLAGWSGEDTLNPGAATLELGANSVTLWQNDGTPGAIDLQLTRSGLSIDMSETPYLAVGWSTHGFRRTSRKALINGQVVEPDAQTGDWNWYRAPAVLDSVTLSLAVEGENVASTFGIIQAFELVRTNHLGPVGTGRQVARSVIVYGSARTQGSLALGHASESLGETLVYVNKECGAGYQPPLDQLYVSGGSLAPDTSTSSGYKIALTTGDPAIFEVPMANLCGGDYAVVARDRSTGTAGHRTLAVDLTVRVDGADLYTQSGLWAGDKTTTWGMHHVGNLYRIDPHKYPTGTLRVTAESNQLELENIWLFNTTTGGLVWVDCGNNRRLWADNPTTDTPVPTIWVGNNADRSDAHHVNLDAISAWDPLYFWPGRMNVFTMCDAINAGASLRHYPRWHTHAGQVET